MSKRKKLEPGPRPRHFIREWRDFRNLSQEQLAERIGLSRGAVSQLETGEVSYTQPTLEAISKALSCSTAELLIRNPFTEEGLWTALQSLTKADAGTRARAIAVIQALLNPTN